MTVFNCLLKWLNVLNSCLHLTMVCQSCFIESLSGRLWLWLVYQRITAGKQIQKQIRNPAMWVFDSYLYLSLIVFLQVTVSMQQVRKHQEDMTHIRTCSISSAGVRYAAEKVQKKCYFFAFFSLPRGIWHLNGSQSQIPHPQAPTKCQFPASGVTFSNRVRA